MSAADFLDTNVLVYLVDREADPRKRAIANGLVTGAVHLGTAVVSAQVVQETLNVVTTRLTPHMPPAGAQEFLRRILLPIWQVQPTPALFSRALALRERYQFSFYDALIVAAALEGGCARLLSEDLQHGQQIEGLTIHNPFLD